MKCVNIFLSIVPLSSPNYRNEQGFFCCFCLMLCLLKKKKEKERERVKCVSCFNDLQYCNLKISLIAKEMKALNKEN